MHLHSMENPFKTEEIDELRSVTPDLSITEEGGYTFIRLHNLHLPSGCTPNIVDALLLPSPRDGYFSRLFFSQRIMGGPERNWNATVRIADSTWHAVSWQTQAGLRLIEMLHSHLKALRHGY